VKSRRVGRVCGADVTAQSHDITKSQKLTSVHSIKHSQCCKVIEIGLKFVDFSLNHFIPVTH
jgi:hypothetical protein